ncbi:MAG TPA: prolyl oligopeptidase family serine peptidase [Candidatus Cloacimonadota bacterium]|nr:prolyl oligopeptidase family serine peptidase [Candidatus Cloacimonadota bacterium]
MREKKGLITLMLLGNMFLFMSLFGEPTADKKEFFLELHGEKLADEYHWLQDKNNPEVMNYIVQENLYADSVMADTQALQKQLLKEFYSFYEKSKNIIYQEVGKVKYFEKWEEGGFKNLYQKKGVKETKILDMQKISEGQKFAKLIAWKISPDNRYMAYLIDFEGKEIGTLFIKNLKTLDEPADSLYGVSHMFSWGAKSYLFYVSRDYPFQFKRLYRHQTGTAFSEDKLIYENPSETGSVDLIEQDQFIQYIISDRDQSEAWYLNRKKPLSHFKPLFPKRPNTYVYGLYYDTVFMFENDKLFSFPINQPEKTTLIRQFDEQTSLYDYMICKDHIILFEEKWGSQQINCINLKDKDDNYIQFPEETYSISKIDSGNSSQDYFDFTYTSVLKPETTYRYDLKMKKLSIQSQKSFEYYDENDYQSDMIFIESHDGKSIPVSLVYKTDLFNFDGSNPLLLRAYGAYGYSQYPWFEPHLFSLLNRGFIYAVAHVRGGSEMGRQWHTDSIGSLKKNSVLDFISVSEGLIQLKYTSSDKLAIFGRSAGGRLINSVVNKKPSLFAVAISEVPACDGINWMLDRRSDLFNQKEFGDPMIQSDYLNYLEWDPYQTIKNQDYPPMMISAGWNDTRVSYWQPLKLTARLRDRKQDQNILLLKTDIDAGHRGGSSGDTYNRDWAYKYAFILKCLR